jgi:hypothetical protein
LIIRFKSSNISAVKDTVILTVRILSSGNADTALKTIERKPARKRQTIRPYDIEYI